MKDLKFLYEIETGRFVYGNILNRLIFRKYSNRYVKWLEAKINYTHCCTPLKEKKKPDFYEWANCNGYTNGKCDPENYRKGNLVIDKVKLMELYKKQSL